MEGKRRHKDSQPQTRVAYIVSMVTGLEAFIYREVEHLRAKGWQISLFATRVRHGDIYAAKSDWPLTTLTGFKAILQLPLLLLRCCLHPGLLAEALRFRALIDLLFALYFAREMQRQKVSHIHCHFGDHKLFVGYFCKRLLGLPLTVTIHSHELHVNPNERLFRHVLPHCERLFAISELAVRLLQERFGVSRECIELSHLGVDTSFWTPDRPVRVLTVARFQPQKGLNYLLEAAAQLKEQHVEFVIVGFGPLDLRQMARDYGVSDRVIIIDKLGAAGLRMLYQSCDIFCLPSVVHPTQGQEGIPVVLMEAMSCAMPVVATRTGAIPEILTEFLVPERSSRELAQAIRALVQDPELCYNSGQRNRSAVQDDFSIANVDLFAERLAAELEQEQ